MESRRNDFARTFAKNQSWLYAYLVTLLGNVADADEVFQEVCVVLWSDYETFDPETNFKRWASVIARNRVLGFRTKQQREARRLSDVAIELLAEEAVERAELLEERRVALHGCLDKLSTTDRQLVAKCYGDANRSFLNVAEQLGRPVNTVYKALQRVRRSLRECVDRQVNAQL
ncbi:ECF RNA polymerase sigma factor SigR [Botrimarina colliarenosi]|uniref:ECF RNA polymerase sigma factor SigR n=1 Tax=Botrimarina colliarenosi TaxID=2528001 RepID=A0A5C6ACR6_9BACT|nr:sigma-70 family RNA polymerase sigma factor [Botrimarina colliarenosi]TWT97754.1 ECF RNA polymerase sigma factor SigR [Botrimarina colliarenosi]